MLQNVTKCRKDRHSTSDECCAVLQEIRSWLPFVEDVTLALLFNLAVVEYCRELHSVVQCCKALKEIRKRVPFVE